MAATGWVPLAPTLSKSCSPRETIWPLMEDMQEQNAAAVNLVAFKKSRKGTRRKGAKLESDRMEKIMMITQGMRCPTISISKQTDSNRLLGCCWRGNSVCKRGAISIRVRRMSEWRL